jgi:hypothetical protein
MADARRSKPVIRMTSRRCVPGDRTIDFRHAPASRGDYVLVTPAHGSARACAGPLLCVLGLAVVLFAVGPTHWAIAESAGGHRVTSEARRATAVAEHSLHGVDTPSAVTPAGRFTGSSAAAPSPTGSGTSL